MRSETNRSALFVSASYAETPGGGGVQRCTREYRQVAEAAGWRLHNLIYDVDQGLLTKLRRRLVRRPYHDFLPRSLARLCLEKLASTGARTVFLNQVEAGPLAPLLRELAPPGTRIILLSHGLDSTDFYHYTRHARGPGSPGFHRSWWLGRQLFEEGLHHAACDLVFCLSESDQWLARWLGARHVTLLPRLVEDDRLDWAPRAGRVGFVGTLGHAPNREGLELLCAALQARSGTPPEIRLVGGPVPDGRQLAARFPCLSYLGTLDDAALRSEASSWCAFLNPVFCYARGASTKLAVPLSWRLPVAGTRAGARGYLWDETIVPLLDTPEALADETLRLSRPEAALSARPAFERIAALNPDLEGLARLFSSALQDALPNP